MGLQTPDFNMEKTYDREDPENRARLILEVRTSGKTIQSVVAVGTRVNMLNFQFESTRNPEESQMLSKNAQNMGLNPDFNIEKTYDREGSENRARLFVEV